MREKPLISVIMNCYNGEKYLNEAINSVITQTYQNWEIIFWDNQSTDNSAEIFCSFKDPRLRYFYAPTHTLLSEARNSALEKTQGDFIAFLDVDDGWLPDKLDRQLDLFIDHDVGLVCSNYWVKSELKNKQWLAYKHTVSTGYVSNYLLKNYFVGLPSLIVKRSALETLNYFFNPSYHIIGDFDLVFRLSVNWKLNYTDEPLAFYRLHGNNETVKHYGGRQITEFECWLSDIRKSQYMESHSNLLYVDNHIKYLKAMSQILQADKKEAYRLMKDLTWSLLKIKLLFVLMLPTKIIHILRN